MTPRRAGPTELRLPARYFGGIRRAPSRRIVSPFSIGLAAIARTMRAYSSGRPRREGKGMPSPSAVAGLLGERRQQRRVEEARRDRHHPHAARGHVARRRQRHADDAALGGGVGDLADLAVVGGDRGGVDADAALASPSGSFSLIAAAASRRTLKLPIRLTLTTLEKYSRLCGAALVASRSAQPIPAQQTETRSPPSAAAACSTAAPTASASVTSAATKPAADLRRQRLALLRVEVGDRPPRPRPSASARAVASPSPEAPPATNAPAPRTSITPPAEPCLSWRAAMDP